MSTGRLLLATGLVSAVGLGYQVGLTRIFSVAQWHHFAYMIISMAMLGFAVSGVLIGLWRDRIRGLEAGLFRWCALLLPVSLVACYEATQRVPFETFEVVTRPVPQLGWLLLLYLVLSAPFFLASACIALAFLLDPGRVGRVYFASMAGSGLGAAGVVGAMFLLDPAGLPYALAGLAAGGFLAATPVGAGGDAAGSDGGSRLTSDGGSGGGAEAGASKTPVGAGSGARTRGTLAAGLIVLLALAAWVGVRGPEPVRVSQYKGLSYALDFPDAEVVAGARSPVSLLTAVRSAQIRETPGQLGAYPMEELGRLPEQVGLYFDADAVSPVHRFRGNLEDFRWLGHVTSALPYRLVDRPKVAVIGAGGGTEVLSALHHGAREVVAVEVDPRVFPLVRGPLGEFSGGLYDRPDVRPVVAEGRGFLTGTDETFDVIQIALLDSFTAASAGVHALSESYLYTREAMERYLDRLAPGGVLAVTRWLETPPRDAVKLLATLVEAAERSGYADPGLHLAKIRSWNTATVVFSRDPLTGEGVEAVRDFAESRGFDRSWHPGLRREETNRYTVLETPAYFDAARSLLAGGEERERFYADYVFHVRPATDDRPYFFRSFRWDTAPELLDTLGRDWVNFLEGGYVVLAGTVLQAGAAVLLLVLLPLGLFGGAAAAPRTRRSPETGSRREAAGGGPRSRSGGSLLLRGWTVVLFGGLGLGYMFLEIAFIQRFMLFLHHPVYAVATVLAGFLVFSGLGSWFADRRLSVGETGSTGETGPGDATGGRLLGRALAVMAVAAALYLLFLGSLFEAGAGWPDAARVAVSLILLAPLAFCMGIPFPVSLQLLSHRREGLVPWAWGVNGGASVMGAALAALLAVHGGFTAVVGLAAPLYAAVLLSYLRIAARLGG